jgi:hypothetical protein
MRAVVHHRPRFYSSRSSLAFGSKAGAFLFAEPEGGLEGFAGTSGAGRLCCDMEAELSFRCMGGILRKDDFVVPP